MAITEAEVLYLESLQEQKKLISELGSSGPKIPGLNVEAIALKLAELDTNLQDTIQYYKDLADQEAAKEEQQQADAGVVETEEQKKARRDKKIQEALKKVEDIEKKYVESQRDFIQEQISIIEVNAGIITKEVATLPKTIILALTTALQPAAIGAAVPNYLYNLGILFQNLSAIGRSLGTIKTAFLDMLIAADKIKFVLPTGITGLLQGILNIEEKLKNSKPSEDKFDQPPPPAPIGSRITLLNGEFLIPPSNLEYAIVTAESKFGINKGQVGQILDVLKDSSGNTTGIEILVVPGIPPPPPPPPPNPEPEPTLGEEIVKLVKKLPKWMQTT